MDESQERESSYTNATCSRGEAMELAMRTAVIAHLAICLLALFGLAGTMGPAGIWLGLGVAAILAAAIPFVILPASAALGFLLHWIFHRTQLSVSKTVTITIIICEVALLGWLVFFILLFAQG